MPDPRPGEGSQVSGECICEGLWPAAGPSSCFGREVGREPCLDGHRSQCGEGYCQISCICSPVRLSALQKLERVSDPAFFGAVAFFFNNKARLSTTRHDYFDAVRKWVGHLSFAASCSRPVVIYALALLTRVQDKVQRRLGPGNVRIIIISALMCAHAMCSDLSYNAKAWAGISEGRFTPQDLVQAQRSFLTLMSWDAWVGSQELERVAQLVYEAYLEARGSGFRFSGVLRPAGGMCSEV